jgi:2-polyprenyl-6-methoxyphenol hydroxylase-like FAD-dependent oxidoreductase
MGQVVRNYDVAVVVASVAGCTAAILFARAGLKVALIERRQDIDAYRKFCTHYIIACATPVMVRLGLDKMIRAAGGLESELELWTRYGWIRPHPGKDKFTSGLNIRREKLDPMLRQLADETPDLALILGYAACGLVEENGRFTGVVIQNNVLKRKLTIQAKLIVAADGHYSKMGQMAGVPTRKWPNNRFAYMAYFRDTPLNSGDNAQIWFQDPDIVYAFPTDGGLTLLTVAPMVDKLDEFKQDIRGNFYRYWQDVPDGPAVCPEKQISEIIGIVKGHIIQRQASLPGLAFIGDAALSSDPVWGVGLGWAFQSAGWLFDDSLLSLKGDGDLDRALVKYRWRHRLSLAGHNWHINSYANGRGFYPFEKLYFAAAARDGALAGRMHAYAARKIVFLELAAPHWAIWAGLVLLGKGLIR